MLQDFGERDNLGCVVIANPSTNEAKVFYRSLLEVQYDTGGEENKQESSSHFYFMELEQKRTNYIVVYDLDAKDIGYITKEKYDERINSIPTNLVVDYPLFRWTCRGKSLESNAFSIIFEDNVNGLTTITINKDQCTDKGGNTYEYSYPDLDLSAGDEVRFKIRGLNKSTDYSNFTEKSVVKLKEIIFRPKLDEKTYNLNVGLNTGDKEYEYFVNGVSKGKSTTPSFTVEITTNQKYTLKVICEKIEGTTEYTPVIGEWKFLRLDSIVFRKITFGIQNNGTNWKFYSTLEPDKFIVPNGESYVYVSPTADDIQNVEFYSVKTSATNPAEIKATDLKLTNNIGNLDLSEFPDVDYQVLFPDYGKVQLKFALNEYFIAKYRLKTDSNDGEWTTTGQSVNNIIDLDNMDYGKEYDLEINQLKYDVFIPQKSFTSKDLPFVNVEQILGVFKSIKLINKDTSVEGMTVVLDLTQEQIENSTVNSDENSNFFQIKRDFELTENTPPIKIKYKLRDKLSNNSTDINPQIQDGKQVSLILDNDRLFVTDVKFIPEENVTYSLSITVIDKYYKQTETEGGAPFNILDLSEENTEFPYAEIKDEQDQPIVDYTKYNIRASLTYQNSYFSGEKIYEYIRIPRAWVIGSSEIGFSTYLVDRDWKEKPVIPSIENPVVVEDKCEPSTEQPGDEGEGN